MSPECWKRSICLNLAKCSALMRGMGPGTNEHQRRTQGRESHRRTGIRATTRGDLAISLRGERARENVGEACLCFELVNQSALVVPPRDSRRGIALERRHQQVRQPRPKPAVFPVRFLENGWPRSETGAMREANCCRVTARIGTTRGLGCGDFLLAVRPATYLKFFCSVFKKGGGRGDWYGKMV
jgi:hypothetical protein